MKEFIYGSLWLLFFQVAFVNARLTLILIASMGIGYLWKKGSELRLFFILSLCNV